MIYGFVHRGLVFRSFVCYTRLVCNLFSIYLHEVYQTEYTTVVNVYM